VSASASLWLGFDIGGTKLAVVVGDETGRIAARRRRPIAASGDPRRDLDAMVADGRALLAEAGVRPEALRGVGVAAPGPVDPGRGTVESPPNLVGWKSVPVVQTFADAFGVPAHLENDADAAALAEWRFGAGQGARNLVYLTMSTGGPSGASREPRPAWALANRPGATIWRAYAACSATCFCRAARQACAPRLGRWRSSTPCG
jgi:glucokinase